MAQGLATHFLIGPPGGLQSLLPSAIQRLILAMEVLDGILLEAIGAYPLDLGPNVPVPFAPDLTERQVRQVLCR